VLASVSSGGIKESAFRALQICPLLMPKIVLPKKYFLKFTGSAADKHIQFLYLLRDHQYFW